MKKVLIDKAAAAYMNADNARLCLCGHIVPSLNDNAQKGSRLFHLDSPAAIWLRGRPVTLVMEINFSLKSNIPILNALIFTGSLNELLR